MTSTYKITGVQQENYEIQYHWAYNSGVPQDSTTVQSSILVIEDSETYSGQDNPAWKSIIRNRGDATNPAFGFRTKTKLQKGSYNWAQEQMITIIPSFPDLPFNIVGYVDTCNGYGQLIVVPLPNNTVIDSTEAQDIAKVAFVNAARKRMSPTQGGVILGELRETLHLIKSPAMALRNGISRYLGRVKSQRHLLKNLPPKQARKAVAGLWLESAFGWQPLLHDIDDSMQSLARIVTGIPPNEEVSAGGKATVDLGTVFTAGSGGFQSFEYSYHLKEETRAQVYGAINKYIDPVPTFRGSFGLMPHDWVPTLWELIPYSFVADYFANIGDIISCASFSTATMQWMGMSVTGKRICTSQGAYDTTIYTNVPGFQKQGGSINGGSCTRSYETFQRIGAFNLVPSFHFRIPGSPRVAFNLAALFQQADGARFHR